MSIIMKRQGLGTPITICCSETDFGLSSDSEIFEVSNDKQRSRDTAIGNNESIIYDSEGTEFDRSWEISGNTVTDQVDSLKKKRRRSISSSEESQSDGSNSRSDSPEIVYGGSPVKYNLQGGALIVKTSISAKTKSAKKCTDLDISAILESDNEEIFDSIRSTGRTIVGTLEESPRTSMRSTESLTDSKNFSSNPDSPQKTPTKLFKEQGVSFKIKLRRSTETSNYKIEKRMETEERRISKRSTRGTPKRCGDKTCDLDHTFHATTGTPRKASTVKKSAAITSRSSKTESTPSIENSRRISKATTYVLENDTREATAKRSIVQKNNGTPQKQVKTSRIINDDEDTDSDMDIEALNKIPLSRNARGRSAQNSHGTPAKQIKKSEDVVIRSSGRPKRSSTLVSYNYDVLEDNAMRQAENKKNEGVRNTRRSLAESLRTPQKQKITEQADTPTSARPRRNSRWVNYDDSLENNTLNNKENISNKDVDEDDARPRGKRIRSITATPQKQLNAIGDAMTPKRSVFQTVEEETTPKRTPRKLTIKEIDEPTTPTIATRKISKAVTPSVKTGSLTPSMTRRTANVGKPKTVLEAARAQLHVSAVPKSLPCREEEYNDIYKFLEKKLLDKSGGCIYISGVPGTGKTATVNEVVKCLKKLADKGEMENFDFIDINGMKLSEPRQAYVQILKQINGQSATWEQSYQILEKRFTQSTAKRPMTLLLVDELDILCNKRQDVVYNLLDWPAKANAHLVVITIANTMDLPERVLMGRVTSRLGLTRLTFQPYNHQQLQVIIRERIKDSEAFKSEAIQLVARKVAAVSGDARRALDICRRATEIAEISGDKIVTISHVNQALTEMIASAKVQAIKHCSEMERLFLQAVCAEVTRTGVEETSFQNVYRQLEALCSFEGFKIPNITQSLGICARLGANRLLLCEHSRTDTQQRIFLNVSLDDVQYAMQTLD